MIDPNLDDAKAVISDWAELNPIIQRVYIFGSRLRGTDRLGQPVKAGADIDIAVELTHENPDHAWSEYGLINDHWRTELGHVLPWPVDLEWFHPEATHHLIGYLEDCSVVVFER